MNVRYDAFPQVFPHSPVQRTFRRRVNTDHRAPEDESNRDHERQREQAGTCRQRGGYAMRQLGARIGATGRAVADTATSAQARRTAELVRDV